MYVCVYHVCIYYVCIYHVCKHVYVLCVYRLCMYVCILCMYVYMDFPFALGPVIIASHASEPRNPVRGLKEEGDSKSRGGQG